MRKLIVDKKYNNKKLTNFLLDSFNGLSMSTIYKALRKKDILINDVRIKDNVTLNTGDNVTVYITDNYLFKQVHLNIIFEDENILVVNKPIGIEVVDTNSCNETLTTILEKQTDCFISPCHRLDRNTTGLVLFAKNEESLKILLDKFQNREISKFYRCMVYGIPKQKSSTLQAYLFKDNKKSLVYIYDTPRTGSVKIITSYKVLETNLKQNTSILEVELHTGKTHQIRAHLAHVGLPIIGDRKIWKKRNKQKIQQKCSRTLRI